MKYHIILPYIKIGSTVTTPLPLKLIQFLHHIFIIPSWFLKVNDFF
nr:MAG TPA: hypothetical protein [Caudoviricetes sp.]